MTNNRLKVYSHEDFSRNTKEIIKQKRQNGQNFILSFPALPNEDLDTARNELEIAMQAKESGLVDHVCLVFAGAKKDDLAKMAEMLGVTVVYTPKVDVPGMLPSSAGERGKGADLRRFGYWAYNNLFTGDLEKNIVASLDIDITPDTFGMHYISAIFGPHAFCPQKIKQTKLVYWREPGFGRVTKLVGQPLLSLFNHPKLMPLRSLPYIFSGEVAWNGEAMLELEFCQRYGIEMYNLLQIVLDDKFGKDCLALVNVGKMDHRHQDLGDLRWMSFGIIRVFFYTLSKYEILTTTDHTSLSSIFQYSEVNMDDQVVCLEKSLQETIYPPLSTILKPKV